MKETLIRCEKCRGTGKAPLARKLRAALNTIQSLGSPTMPEIRLQISAGQHKTAVNQLVRRLIAARLVTRSNAERVPRYSVVK